MTEVYVVFAISMDMYSPWSPVYSIWYIHTYIAHAYSKPKKSLILLKNTDKANNSDKLLGENSKNNWKELCGHTLHIAYGILRYYTYNYLKTFSTISHLATLADLYLNARTSWQTTISFLCLTFPFIHSYRFCSIHFRYEGTIFTVI